MQLEKLTFRLISLVVLVVAFLVLLGWHFQISSLVQVFPQLPAMNPLTAVAFILCSFMLFSFSLSSPNRFIRILMEITCFILFVIALIRLSDFFSNDMISIDTFLYHSEINTLINNSSRMAYATAVNFLLFSIGAFLRRKKNRTLNIISLILFVVGLSISFFALTLFILKSFSLLDSPFFFNMAVHTAILFLLLFISVYFVRPSFLETSQSHVSTTAKLYLMGIFCLLSIPIWNYVFKPEVLRLPPNFSYSVNVMSNDNLYDNVSKKYSGEVISKSKMEYQTVAVEDKVQLIKNSFEVKKYNDEPIFKVDRLYAVDRQTGEHVSSFGDRDRKGYLFAPKNLEKQDFVYWHVNYDVPAKMTFFREDVVFGLPVFEYRSQFQADQTTNLTYLPEVGVTKGVELDVDLMILVEPISGSVISYRDESVAWFYDLATHRRIEPWNRFSNQPTSMSVQDQVQRTKQIVWENFIAKKVVPATFFVMAAGSFLFAWLKQNPNSRIFSFLPIVVLITGTVFTFLLFSFVSQSNKNQSDFNFENDVESVIDLITRRLEVYSFTLQSARGFINSSVSVTGDEWKGFVDLLETQKHYPGILAIGFSEMINPNGLVDFENSMRSDGNPDFKVIPEGQREVYSAIKFIEPYDVQNRQLLGFDMYQDQVQRAAMSLAQEIDEPIITGKTKLLQKSYVTDDSGFFMFVPVFQVGTSNVKIEGEPLYGFVFGTFNMNDFMSGALLNQDFGVGVEVYDSPSAMPDALSESNRFYSLPLSKSNVSSTSKISKARTLSVFGHKWTLLFSAASDHGLDTFQKNRPRFILVVGLLITILLSILTYTLSSTREKAVKIADAMTHDLQKKTSELESSNDTLKKEIEIRKHFANQLQVKTNELERFNQVMVDREIKMVELKKELKKCLNHQS